MSIFLSAFANAIFLTVLSLWEWGFFFFSTRIWRLRWLLYSHYFLRRYWLFPAADASVRRQDSAVHGSCPSADSVYGETPFWTAREILLWGGVKKGGTVLDLGCGRGLMVLFSAVYLDARAVGVDLSPGFISIGEIISGKMGLMNVTWINGDFLLLDLSGLPKPDLVYLASTTFSWETIQALARKLEGLQSGVKVVSLSARLPSEAFREIGTKELWFSWGRATAHLHERI